MKNVILLILIELFLVSCTEDKCKIIPSTEGKSNLCICHFIDSLGKSNSMIYVDDCGLYEIERIKLEKDYLIVRDKGRDGAWSFLVQWINERPIIYTPKFGFRGSTGEKITHVKVDAFTKMYHSNDKNNMIRVDQ